MCVCRMVHGGISWFLSISEVTHCNAVDRYDSYSKQLFFLLLLFCFLFF